MKRVIFDSDLYIDWIAAGRHEELFLARSLLRYMSTVVLLELQVGASDGAGIAVVRDLYRSFHRTDRLLSPSDETFWRAGLVLRTLRQRYGYGLQGLYRLTNDCLIALSSRQIGATVMTRNERDFRRIQQIAPFALAIVV